MLHTTGSGTRPVPDIVMRGMFAARKQVFVDLLKFKTRAVAFSRMRLGHVRRPPGDAPCETMVSQARFSRLGATVSTARTRD